MTLTKIKADLGEDGRIETGPLQVNDDWPGLFIRGDNAFHYAMMLQAYLNGAKDPIAEMMVKNLIEELESCNVANIEEEDK